MSDTLIVDRTRYQTAQIIFTCHLFQIPVHRRNVLRRGVAGLAAVTVGSLSGCAGEDEAEAEGTVTNGVDELAVESVTVMEDLGPRYEIHAQIENAGERTVELSEHSMELSVFGENERNLTDEGGSIDYPNRPSEPGETREVQLRVDVTTDAQDVVRWELAIYCDDAFDDGGYCA